MRLIFADFRNDFIALMPEENFSTCVIVLSLRSFRNEIDCEAGLCGSPKLNGYFRNLNIKDGKY